MRKSRCCEERIIRVVQEVESGKSVRDVCRQHGIASGTQYAWKAKYGGMDVNEAGRLKELELENRRPRSAVAQLTLEKQAFMNALARRW